MKDRIKTSRKISLAGIKYIKIVLKSNYSEIDIEIGEGKHYYFINRISVFYRHSKNYFVDTFHNEIITINKLEFLLNSITHRMITNILTNEHVTISTDEVTYIAKKHVAYLLNCKRTI